ncbi:DNA-directed RNA polymerase subunit beta, partial [Candidatus Hakubella thermalkaliphila]
LIGSLATYARGNQFGFIETPYRRVVNGIVTDEIVYLAADEEDEYIIAQANAPFDEKGRLIGDKVLARSRQEVVTVDPFKVDFMDISPKQIVSVATSLIPFLEHDDANRALMGSNMQRQAVPLVRPEAPLIGTGMEFRAAEDSGEVIVAEDDGVIEKVSAQEVEVEYSKRGLVKQR